MKTYSQDGQVMTERFHEIFIGVKTENSSETINSDLVSIVKKIMIKKKNVTQISVVLIYEMSGRSLFQGKNNTFILIFCTFIGLILFRELV